MLELIHCEAEKRVNGSRSFIAWITSRMMPSTSSRFVWTHLWAFFNFAAGSQPGGQSIEQSLSRNFRKYFESANTFSVVL